MNRAIIHFPAFKEILDPEKDNPFYFKTKLLWYKDLLDTEAEKQEGLAIHNLKNINNHFYNLISDIVDYYALKTGIAKQINLTLSQIEGNIFNCLDKIQSCSRLIKYLLLRNDFKLADKYKQYVSYFFNDVITRLKDDYFSISSTAVYYLNSRRF